MIASPQCRRWIGSLLLLIALPAGGRAAPCPGARPPTDLERTFLSLERGDMIVHANAPVRLVHVDRDTGVQTEIVELANGSVRGVEFEESTGDIYVLHGASVLRVEAHTGVDGSVATVVQTTDLALDAGGIAFTSNTGIQRVDLTTGAVATLASASFANSGVKVEVDPITGTLFALDADSLYSVDKTTGALTCKLGACVLAGAGIPLATDLAVDDATGELYAGRIFPPETGEPGQVFRLDLDTGLTTTMLDISTNIGTADGGIDPLSNDYVSRTTPQVGPIRLRRMDVVTGATSLLFPTSHPLGAAINVEFVTCEMDLYRPTSVPVLPPAALVALLLALAAAGRTALTRRQ